MLPISSAELMVHTAKLWECMCRWMWVQTLGVLALTKYLWKVRWNEGDSVSANQS